MDWLCASSNALIVSDDTQPLCDDVPETPAVDAVLVLDDASDDALVVVLKSAVCVEDVLLDDVSDFNRSIADDAAPIANNMANPLAPNIVSELATAMPIHEMPVLYGFSAFSALHAPGKSCRDRVVSAALIARMQPA